jgi:hypothetical protein
VALSCRRQRAVQTNLELVNLVEDAEVFEVLFASCVSRRADIEGIDRVLTETKILAARIGPTVWLDEGPTPIEKRSGEREKT